MVAKKDVKRVVAFGAFDPLHPGHLYFLSTARKHGEDLTVVVARDESIYSFKKREPYLGLEARVQALIDTGIPDKVLPGNLPGRRFDLLRSLEFDVLALGYDQEPSDREVARLLLVAGKNAVEIVRVAPFYPEKYKSTLVREMQKGL